MTVKTAIAEVSKLSDEDYRQFRAAFIAYDKSRQERSMHKYHIGDVVKFDARGRTIYVQITGFGRKRLQGQEVTSSKPHVQNGFTRWKFSGTNCTLVTAAGA